MNQKWDLECSPFLLSQAAPICPTVRFRIQTLSFGCVSQLFQISGNCIGSYIKTFNLGNTSSVFMIVSLSLFFNFFHSIPIYIYIYIPFFFHFNKQTTPGYPSKVFRGTKHFVLSTSSWIGGRNFFLPIAYMSVGSLSFVLGFVFALLHLFFPRYFFLCCVTPIFFFSDIVILFFSLFISLKSISF